MSSELYIDGQRVDMGDDKVGITLQANDLFELKDRQASRSNRFSTPMTVNNKSIYGNVETILSTTDRPYKRLSAKYIEDGVELIPSGFCKFEQAKDKYEQTIYSGILDFFSQLEGKDLSDLDLDDLDHTWDTPTIVASRTNTDGFIYPLVDWNTDSETLPGPYFGFTTRVLDSRTILPCLFVHDLIQRIADQTNYTISGDILLTAKYRKLLLGFQLNKLEYNDAAIKKKKFKVQLNQQGLTGNSDQTILVGNWTNSGNNHKGAFFTRRIIFNDETTQGFFDNQSAHDNVLGQYVAPSSGKYTFTADLVFDLTCNQQITSITNSLLMRIAKKSGATITTLASVSLHPNAVGTNFTASMTTGTITLQTGDLVYVETTQSVWNINTTSSSQPIASVVFKKQSTFENDADKQILFGGDMFLSGIFGNMKQVDLIKTVAQIYGITFVPDNVNKVIYFRQFKELYANKAKAKNMTQYRDASAAPTVKTRFGSYAQTNWMRWKQDDTHTSVSLGDGFFTIADETLEKEKDMFILPFAASEDKNRLNGFRVVNIPKHTAGVIDTNTEPRLFMLDMLASITDGNGDITYEVAGVPQANINTNIPLTYFIKAGQDDSLGFDESLINQEYYELTRYMLNKPKALTERYKLNISQIKEFDHFIPWYDDEYGNYFYVNVIDNFRKDRTTEVELIRM